MAKSLVTYDKPLITMINNTANFSLDETTTILSL